MQRGGHSDGYWFKPTVTDTDNKLLFSGSIEYNDIYTKDSKLYKIKNKVEEICLLVFLLPVVLIIKLCILIINLIKKDKKTTDRERGNNGRQAVIFDGGSVKL